MYVYKYVYIYTYIRICRKLLAYPSPFNLALFVVLPCLLQSHQKLRITTKINPKIRECIPFFASGL